MTLILALLLANLPQQLPEAQVKPVSRGADPRSQRPWVISGELGWNGLAGVGAVVTRHFSPHLSLDAGLGYSGEGPKVGMRGRYNVLVQEGTPFVGAGFLYGTGTQGTSGGSAYTVGPSPFLQFTVGIEYQSRAGFKSLCAFGYALLLRENLTPANAGPPGERELSGGGPVLSLSFGYAF
jgi:hypothetical protein